MLFSHSVSSASISKASFNPAPDLGHAAGGPSMTVAGSDFAHVYDAALPNQIGGQKFCKLLHAVAFAAGREQQLPEGEIGNRLRHAGAQLPGRSVRGLFK